MSQLSFEGFLAILLIWSETSRGKKLQFVPPVVMLELDGSTLGLIVGWGTFHGALLSKHTSAPGSQSILFKSYWATCFQSASGLFSLI